MSVFKKNETPHNKQPMFFGESVAVQRYDKLKYPSFDKQNDKMQGFFWRPSEVDVSKDRLDFQKLTKYEQHIFTSNLKRQILLDSIQGRGISETLVAATSLPEIEGVCKTWEFMENIHSRSYTHIIEGVYPNASKVFDDMLDIPEILECGDSISKYYDDFITALKIYELQQMGYEVREEVGDSYYDVEILPTNLKKKLWLCLNAINILEGVRFYVSFACSWAFAELKKMEGNAKIIKFICRDENLHLAASTAMLKNLVKEDSIYAALELECREEVKQMFMDAIEQEKRWAEYLFKDGSMIGLNANLLTEYIEWIGAKRMRALGYEPDYSVSRTNPLPWTEKWIGGGNVQVAPQETEITSYIDGGGIRKDSLSGLKGFTL